MLWTTWRSCPMTRAVGGGQWRGAVFVPDPSRGSRPRATNGLSRGAVESIWRSRRTTSTNRLSGGQKSRAGEDGDRRRAVGGAGRWKLLRARPPTGDGGGGSGRGAGDDDNTMRGRGERQRRRRRRRGERTGGRGSCVDAGFGGTDASRGGDREKKKERGQNR
jgi:hypothetical protein